MSVACVILNLTQFTINFLRLLGEQAQIQLPTALIISGFGTPLGDYSAPTPPSSPHTLLPPPNAVDIQVSAVAPRPTSTNRGVHCSAALIKDTDVISALLAPTWNSKSQGCRCQYWRECFPHQNKNSQLSHDRETESQTVTNGSKKRKLKLGVGEPSFLKQRLTTLALALPKVPAEDESIPRSVDHQSCEGAQAVASWAEPRYAGGAS